MGTVNYDSKNTNLLFFIIIFLLLFYDGSYLEARYGITLNSPVAGDNSILFFILVFLLLFY